VDADTIVERTVSLLRPGDILAHPFTRHPGGFVDKDGKVRCAIGRATKP
jgi:dihydroorotase